MCRGKFCCVVLMCISDWTIHLLKCASCAVQSVEVKQTIINCIAQGFGHQMYHSRNSLGGVNSALYTRLSAVPAELNGLSALAGNMFNHMGKAGLRATDVYCSGPMRSAVIVSSFHARAIADCE